MISVRSLPWLHRGWQWQSSQTYGLIRLMERPVMGQSPQKYGRLQNCPISTVSNGVHHAQCKACTQLIQWNEDCTETPCLSPSSPPSALCIYITKSGRFFTFLKAFLPCHMQSIALCRAGSSEIPQGRQKAVRWEQRVREHWERAW